MPKPMASCSFKWEGWRSPYTRESRLQRMRTYPPKDTDSVESLLHTMPALAARLTPFSRKPKPQAQSCSSLRRRPFGEVRWVFCRPGRVLVGSGVEPVLSDRRRWEYPNSCGSLAVHVRQLDYRRLRSAANPEMLPNPEPRAMPQYFVVPSIGSSAAACAEGSNIRRFEDALKALVHGTYTEHSWTPRLALTQGFAMPPQA